MSTALQSGRYPDLKAVVYFDQDKEERWSGTSSTAVQTAFTSWVNQNYMNGTGTELAQVAAQYAGGDTQPPSTPGSLSASGTTSSSTNLSWNASTDNAGVTGYDILRAPGASGGTFSQVGTSTTTSFTNAGLSANATYRYQVRARDAAGNTSPVSNTITVTTTGDGGGGGCTATMTAQSEWNNGYVIQPVRATNTGTSTITGWTVTFTLPAGHTVTGWWNAALTTNGQTVTAHGVGYNSTLAPGAVAEWGFQASRPNGNAALPGSATCTSP
jgi:cellulase/cellobiase CelA1